MTNSYDDEFERSEKRGGKKIFRSKKMIAAIAGIGAALVVLVVVLALLMRGGSSSAKSYTKERDIYHFVFDDETIYFVFDGKKVESRVDAEQLDDWNTSMDGKTAIFTAVEDEDEMLYLLSDGTVLPITENTDQFRMAESGATVAYLSDDEELYLYNTAKRAAEKLASDVERIMTLSPDGKSVAYSGYDDITYVYSGGKVRELGEKVEVISVSNEGKYIYAYETDADGVVCLNLYNMKGFVGLVGEDFYKNVCFTNASHTQLMFLLKSGKGYKWYAVEEKEGDDERHTISAADYILPVVPENVPQYYTGLLCVVGVSDLTDLPYRSGNTEDKTEKLIYLNSEWGISTLATKVQDVTINQKGSVLYYTKNEKLYSIAASADAESTMLADDVQRFVLGTDGTVYYFDEFETLYSVKSGSESKEIFDEAEEVYVAHDGTVFFVADETLYTLKKGKASIVVEDFMEDSALVTAVDCTYYLLEDDGEYLLYAATKGTEFKKLGALLTE